MLAGNVDQLDLMSNDALGWTGLLVALRNYLETLTVTIYVDQVKEKFGGLRFYFHIDEDVDGDDYQFIVDVVNAVESLSSTTCYLCPRRSTHQGHGRWVRWFCDEHDTDDLVRTRNELTVTRSTSAPAQPAVGDPPPATGR